MRTDGHLLPRPTPSPFRMLRRALPAAWALLGILFLPALLPSRAAAAPAGPSRADVPLRAASEYDYPPFAVVTAEGQADGFSVELLRAALHAMGRQVVFEVGPWNRIKDDLTAGRIQVLPLVGRTPEREALYDFTFPYLTMHGTLIVRRDERSIHDLDCLRGRQVAVMGGDNAEEFLRRNRIGATIVTTETFEQALRELDAGRHDAVVIQKLVALQLMKQLGLTNLKPVGPPLEGFVQSLCFAVKKGDSALLNVLNEGLALVMADGTYQRLRVKWFAPIEAAAAGRSRIVVGGDNDYAPYEYLDKNGEPAGYNVDLTRAIAKQLGLAVEIRLGPWSRIRESLKKGEIDLIQGMFYSPERDRDFNFSPPHTLISHVAVFRNGTAPPATMADLAGKRLLVMEGDIMHDAAERQGYAEQLIRVKTQQEALRLLAEGQGDYALVAKVPALFWIRAHNWNNLTIAEPSLLSAEYCYATPGNNQALLAQFTEGLAAIKATGEYRDIHSRWLGVYEAPRIGTADILKYSLFVAAPITLLLFGSLLWSRSLQRKVRHRTAELSREVTERLQKEQEIRAKNRELDEKNAELESFIFTVSHDLKSPLVTLKTFLGYFEQDLADGDQEKIQTDLHYMHTAADKMNRLLVDLLEMSRVGRLMATPERVTFRQVVDEALALVAGSLTEKGIRVRVEEVCLEFWGDRGRLVELWQNLVDNAVKYMGNQPEPAIEIGLEQRPDGPVFHVRDNGMGIEPAFQEKIFGLFNQLDPKAEGSGLGLALVRKIVELYNGKIWVESAGLGQGSCFRFTLPTALMDAQPAASTAAGGA